MTTTGKGGGGGDVAEDGVKELWSKNLNLQINKDLVYLVCVYVCEREKNERKKERKKILMCK